MLHPLVLNMMSVLLLSIRLAFAETQDISTQPSSSVIGALESFQSEQARLAEKDGLHTPLKGVTKTECGCTASEANPSIVESLSALQKTEEVKHPNSNHPASSQEIKILIFVSSSMNSHDLKTLAEEAKTHQAALVMRGLIDGSFQKTMPFVQSLKGSVMLDPRLFKAFQVDAVPTFVRLHEPLSVKGGVDTIEAPAHDKVRGNLTLLGAMQIMKGATS